MGDCRLRIKVSEDLLVSDDGGGGGTTASSAEAASGGTNGTAKRSGESSSFVVITKVLSSDTTVREVVDETLIPLQAKNNRGCDGDGGQIAILALLEGGKACLWDCTLNPPKNITDTPLVEFPNRQGAKSMTLVDAGWFPGAALQVLPRGQSPRAASAEQYDDFQYNTVDPTNNRQQQQQERPRVQLSRVPAASSSDIAPSQLLGSVTTRFADEDAQREAETAAARLARIEGREQRRAKEEARRQKLDDRIRKLEEMQQSSSSSEKKKKVSDQVQRMLIKSRATGRSDLKMQDRLYFRFAVVVDAESDGENDGASPSAAASEEAYRYFSPQDSVGRILSTFALHTKNGDGEWQAELLVRRRIRGAGDDTYVYRRLPVLLRIYEAMASKHVSEFDKLVVRIFDAKLDEPTPSVDDDGETVGGGDSAAAAAGANAKLDEASESACEGVPAPNDPTRAATSTPSSEDYVDSATSKRMVDCVRAMEENDSGKQKTTKKKTASSAAALKVKQIQMKGKAKGDAKRIKMEDRFFVELVQIRDGGSSDSCTATSSSPVFVAKSDTFERLVRDCASSPGSKYELLVPPPASSSKDDDNTSFRRITNLKMTLEEAENCGIVNSFDRLIVRVLLF